MFGAKFWLHVFFTIGFFIGLDLASWMFEYFPLACTDSQTMNPDPPVKCVCTPWNFLTALSLVPWLLDLQLSYKNNPIPSYTDTHTNTHTHDTVELLMRPGTYILPWLSTQPTLILHAARQCTELHTLEITGRSRITRHKLHWGLQPSISYWFMNSVCYLTFHTPCPDPT